MDRRDFFRTAGAGSVLAMMTGSVAAEDQSGSSAAGDRAAWIALARRLADPVLTNLANGTLKARMPVEQAPGTDRRSVTHLEALGRLLAGLDVAVRSRRIALQSVAAGIGLSVAGMIAAALGYLSPVQGSLLQEAIDVAVILNALRALRISPEYPRQPNDPLQLAVI